MQRTYLALAALACGAALQTLALTMAARPLLANTFPSRAPLNQGRSTGRTRATEIAPRIAPGRAPAPQLDSSAIVPLLPPPPLDDDAQVVALEVIPYTP